MPLLPDNCDPGPAPPVRNDGLFATAGLPDPDPPPPAAGPFVAIAVGKTKEGASLPANPWALLADSDGLRTVHEPSLEKPVPLRGRLAECP